jgi:hypothetical protein
MSRRLFVSALLSISVITLVLTSCAPTPSRSLPSQPGPSGVTVYVGAQPSGHAASVYALQGSTGAMRWHVQTEGVFPGLALTNGVVYVTGSRLSGPGGTISAFRASDGSLLWHITVNSFGLSAPLIVGGVLYTVGSLNGVVYALRVSDGSLFCRTQTTHANAGASSPMAADGTLTVVGRMMARSMGYTPAIGLCYGTCRQGMRVFVRLRRLMGCSTSPVSISTRLPAASFLCVSMMALSCGTSN